MPKQVKDFEPHLALFVSDNDPLIFYKKLSEFGKDYLRPNGLIALECNEFNANKVKEVFIKAGFKSVELHKDMSGKWRILTATLS